MYVYCYYNIIAFCYKVRKIQEKKIVKLVIIQAFDWLSKHIVYYFIYKWMWLYVSIINTELMSWV